MAVYPVLSESKIPWDQITNEDTVEAKLQEGATVAEG